MEQEARSVPEIIKQQLKDNEPLVKALAKQLKEKPYKFAMVIGRGSSDHAGVFAKYLLEIELGLPTFAAAPSVSSVYNKQLSLHEGIAIIISQSGRSPDILAQARMAKDAGAFCIALVNDETAPVKDIVDVFIPLRAGEEKAVAATKSYLATLSALLQITAYWKQDAKLISSLIDLPQSLQQVIESKQQLTTESVAEYRNLIVLGRGIGMGICKEIALKLKEVCCIHAEAFSSAEFLHGPVTLVQTQLKLLDVSVADEAFESHKTQVNEVKQRGGDITLLHQVCNKLHPRLAPLAVLQRFYIDVAAIAIAKGINPDEPAGLKKVTQTL